MSKFVLSLVAFTSFVAAVVAQPKSDTPPIRYTVRTDQGERSGRNRDAVLKTVKFSADEARVWAEDAGAAGEARAVTIYQAGYVEGISRGADGKLEYLVRDEAGERASRDPASVLTTRGMTVEKIKAWAADANAKAEGRVVAPPPEFGVQITVSNETGRAWGRVQSAVSSVLKLNADEIRKWAADPKAEMERRGAMLFKSGHVEIIWRGPSGHVLYSVRNEHGSRTGRDSDAVLKTLTMTDEQVRAWVEDGKTAKEARAATFYRDGYAEAIARGLALEPPGLGQ